MWARAAKPLWPARLRLGEVSADQRGWLRGMNDEPHTYAYGWKAHLALAHAAPRCGAKRRDGGTCQSPAMTNGRCRMHGGKSTGPRTAEGLERSRKARWKHGHYSREAREECAEARAGLRLIQAILDVI